MPHIPLDTIRCIYWFSKKIQPKGLCRMAWEERGRVCGESNLWRATWTSAFGLREDRESVDFRIDRPRKGYL